MRDQTDRHTSHERTPQTTHTPYCHDSARGRFAGAAAGAAIGALTGGDVLEGAAIGAAAGAAGGYFIDKDDGCDGYDRDGRLDDDCYGTRGYPKDPR